MWRRFRNIHVLVHVRASGDSPVSLAMTHMRWLHGQSGHGEHGPLRVCSLVPVGCEPGPSIGARARTRAKVNVRLRPLARKDNRQKERIARRRETTKVQTCNRNAAKFCSMLDAQ